MNKITILSVLLQLNTDLIPLPTSTLILKSLRRLLDKLKFHFSPIHRSWLNIIEIESTGIRVYADSGISR